MNKVQKITLASFATLLLSTVSFGFFVSSLDESALLSRININGQNIEELSTNSLQSLEDLEQALLSNQEDFLNKTLTWESHKGSYEITFRELGFMPMPESILKELEPLRELSLQEKLSGFLFGWDLEFPAYVDLALLEMSLQKIEAEQGVKNANYIIVDGLIEVDPEQIGYGLNIDLASEFLMEYWGIHFHEAELSLVNQLPLNTNTPEIRTEELLAHLDEANTYLASSVLLQDSEWSRDWTFNMSDYISFLTPVSSVRTNIAEDNTDEDEATEVVELSEESIEEAPAQSLIPATLQLSKEALIDYAQNQLAPEINIEGSGATITENEDGSTSFEGSARFGRQLDLDAFAEQLNETLFTDKESLMELPINNIQPEITVSDSLKERGITDLLNYGSTSFVGSTNTRIHNVKHGIELFNGHIIEQGDTFSFTTLMGPIDGEHGWLPELVILGDETQKEYGGGLCQVSSTMYRSALHLGLPIAARKNHSYAVSYYARSATDDDRPTGQGLDATIYSNYPDLQFVNDTPSPILIQGYTDGYNAYFVFYGTNDGRSTELEGPYSYDYWSRDDVITVLVDDLEPGETRVNEYATTGFKVDWYRTVNYPEGHYLYPEGSTETENIHSNYEARPLRIEEGQPAEETDEEITGDLTSETPEALVEDSTEITE
jgi:vancomycin resistance protein YoaR